MNLPAALAARPMTPADIDTVVDLITACERADDGVVEVDRDDLVAGFRRAGFDPALDGVIVLDTAHPVGWGELYRGRAEADVLPSHRGRGIGAALLAWTEARASILGESTIRQTKTDANASARDLFLASGYDRTGTSWIIRIALEPPPAPPEVPEDISIRAFDPERDALEVYRLIDAAFSEWPGRDPSPFEVWGNVVDHPAFAAALSLVALDGDRIVGALLAYDYPEAREGWVQQLATRPSHRRRGIASALLRTAFVRFHRLGRERCGVSTDSRTGALSLYERVGMRVDRSYSSYEKALEPGR